jgi:transcriptional regulator with XRE-family HTH domain
VKRKIRYQSKTDLKGLREIYKISKDDVADKIGYSKRHLERMERENAVTGEETVRQFCDLYRIAFEEQFYRIDQEDENWLREALSNKGEIPDGSINNHSKYYYLYVRKLGIFKDCISGKGLWIADYNRNKEIRRLREVDAKKVLMREPNITIINNEKEWNYWYFKLCIGKSYEVVVAEECMKECLNECLDEVIVKRSELMKVDGITDIMFLGTKNRIKK